MRKLVLLGSFFWLFLSLSSPVLFGDELKVTVPKAHIRLNNSEKSELLGSALKGDVLESVGEDGDWVKIVPPPGVYVYVLGELIREGAVAAPFAPVRSSPGINYHSFLLLTKGDKVKVKGSSGEWLKIVPPKGCYVWVSRKCVTSPTMPLAVPPENAVANTGSRPGALPEQPIITRPDNPPPFTHVPPPVVSEPSTQKPSVVAAPDPNPAGKGYKGVLREGSFFASFPSKYKLVTYNSKGRAEGWWFVDNSKGLVKAGMLNKTVIVYGEEKTMQGVKDPVLVPTKIVEQKN